MFCSKGAFALLSDVSNDEAFEFEMKESTLEFDKMIPSSEYLSPFEQNIQQEPPIYSYDRCQIHYFPYASGLNDLSVYSMFHTDKLPSYLVFGFVVNEAFDVTKDRLIPFEIGDQQQRDWCQTFSSGHNFMDKSIDCRQVSRKKPFQIIHYFFM